MDKEMQDPEPKKRKKKPAEDKPRKKAEPDMGKVRALREGGWSMEKIADEMGVSAATIYNRLKERPGDEI